MSKCKLTPELTRDICKTIIEGNFDYIAARVNRVGKTTFYEWMKKGEQQKTGKYRNFRDSIRHAEAIREQNLVSEVRVKDPKYVLSHTNNERWGQDIMKVEHSGKITWEQFRQMVKENDKDTS